MRIRIPSPATIIASLALLLSLTGTAVAGALITGAQIQNNTVSSLDLMNNRVKSVDLKDNDIKRIDAMNGQLRAVDFAPGQIQPGPAGPAGPAGPLQGAPGLAGVEIVTPPSARGSNREPSGRPDVPGGQAGRRRRCAGLRRDRRSGSRRELSGRFHPVVRQGLRSGSDSAA